MRRDGAQHRLVINDEAFARPPPWLDRAVERPIRVRNDERLIENHFLTEAVADGTRAGGRVEGKMFRRRRVVTLAGRGRTHFVRVEGFGPNCRLPIADCRLLGRAPHPGPLPIRWGEGVGLVQREHHTFAKPQGSLHGIAKADADFVVHHEPVHDGLDVVEFLFVELDARDVLAQFHDFTVHAHTHEAVAGEALKHVAELAFLPAHDGREQHDFGFRRQREDFIHDVAGALRGDGNAGFRAMRLADMRVKQAQVIINLRGRGDDRTRAAAGASLLNRNRGRQAFDEIHVRFLQLVEKLARVGGKRLDIFALALGVNRVERER